MTALFINTLLLSFRLMPLTLVSPLAFFRRAPLLVRLILTVSIALIIASAIDSPNEVLVTWGGLASEFAIGVTLAFSFHAATAAVQTMGRVLDQQIGFAAASVFDPHNETMEGLTGEILTLALLIVFVTMDVHHAILKGFVVYAEQIPPGTMFELQAASFKILGIQFIAGFALVAPVMLTLWLIDVALAFISRSLPQANIYFVGLPLKIGVGILCLAWTISSAAPVLFKLLSNSLESWAMVE